MNLHVYALAEFVAWKTLKYIEKKNGYNTESENKVQSWEANKWVKKDGYIA